MKTLLSVCVWLVSVGSVPAARALDSACKPGHGWSQADLARVPLDAGARSQLAKAVLAIDPQSTYRVDAIRVTRQNIFPERQYWIARLANRLNPLTREAAVVAALPFKSGANVTGKMLIEAERILRDKDYLYDAAIWVRTICEGDPAAVTLDVVTRDVWTLSPDLSYSRSGGDEKSSIGFSDANFVGSGKSVGFNWFDNADRDGIELSLRDPNVAGTDWAARLDVADNSDGEHVFGSLGRPFVSLDTPVAFGVSAARTTRQQDLEFLSDDAFEFDAQISSARVFVARSLRRESDRVHRLYGGVAMLDEQYEFGAEFPPPRQVDRKLVYPFIAWQTVSDHYVQRKDIFRIGIIEDIPLGWNTYTELGWSDAALGADDAQVLVEARLEYRDFLTDNQFVELTAGLQGRYNTDTHQAEDVIWRAAFEHLWLQSAKWQLDVSGGLTVTDNLSLEKQLTLGGDSGLRGYPNRYQIGDRAFNFSLEQRYIATAFPWGLFRFAYVAFLDVGQAWFDDHAPAWVPHRDGDHFGVLANVGFGVRIDSARTRRDHMFHLDVARPLVDGPEVSDFEITFSVRKTL